MNLEIFILIFFHHICFLNYGAAVNKIQIHIFKGRDIFFPKPVIRGLLKPALFPHVNIRTNISRPNWDKQDVPDRCITPENKPGVCKEFSECSRLYNSLPSDVNDWHIFKCWIPEQTGEVKPNGFCCPAQENDFTSKPTTTTTTPAPTTPKPTTGSTNVTTKLEDLNCKYENTHTLPCFENIEELNKNILRSSLSVVEQLNLRSKLSEEELLLTQRRLQEKSFHHSGIMESASTDELSKFADTLVKTSIEIASRLKLERRQKIFGLKRINNTVFPELNKYCVQNPACNVSKYRSIDGSCNNVQIPRQGQSFTPLRRILPPSYSDGLLAPRVASDCSLLPAAPILIRSLIKQKNVPSDKHSLLFAQFWQFLFSDFGSTQTPKFEISGLKCCQNPEDFRNKRCYPIQILEDAPLPSHTRRCTDFLRAQLSPRIDCSLGYADQMNEGTHWIDLSNLYGSNIDEANELRLYRNGLLRHSRASGKKNLLPLRETSGDDCTVPERGIFCFHSGDRKVNELTGLLVTHMLWFREHNRIASELKSINIEWSDEELYQEARRIVIAEYQHIIYNEWMHLFIGKNSITRTANQNILKEELFDGDSSVSNEFFSAAFRIDHSLQQGIVHLIKEFRRNNDSASKINYNNPHSIRSRGQVDKWIKGLTRQPSQFHDSFKNFNVQTDEQPRAFSHEPDWGSFIIQRGRDAGLPGYNFYRQLCFRTRVKRFEEMNDFIDEETINILKQHYKNVDDVDLWIGGLLEKPLIGQFVGPTFACIIDDQFFRSRQGDRYFYDIRNQLHSFSEDQLSEIRKASFARILCDNGDNLNETQPSAFLLPHDKTNPTVSCNDIKRIHRLDLSLWENEPTPPEAIRST